MRLSYGEVDLLLGGDAEAPVEYRLVEEGFELNSEILKVHHHGVNDASTPAYLDAVDPWVALIPVATYETYFGSIPEESILNRFRARSMDIFASDRAEPLDIRLRGDRGHHVTVVTDGVSYEVILEESSSRHYPPRGVEGCLGGEDP